MERNESEEIVRMRSQGQNDSKAGTSIRYREREVEKKCYFKKEREGEREKGRKGGRKELGHRNRMSALFK